MAVAVAATAALALTACSGGSSSGNTSSSTSASSAAKSSIKVGLAYDVGGRGDKSFNDSAAKGLDKAVAELGVTKKELEATQGESDSQKEERLRLLAQGGYDPIVAVGFAYAGPLKKVAAEFPKIHFAIIDDSSFKAANVANLVFAENQGSFLVGAIAAQASKTGTIGYIGGVNVPLLQKFQAGYEAGAKAVNPNIKVLSKYLTEPPDFSGFSDPAKGKTAAQGQLDAGADVIYAAAGGSGSGAFEAIAAKGKGNWAIGVDSDQYQTASATVRDFVLTSMLKRVDVAVYTEIKAAVDGKPLTGEQVFDLKVDGVGYSTSNSAVQPFAAKADTFKQQIISGSVTAPTAPAK
ncbi:MAG TPA: BMP family ABC transporter substrate-binding protein [Kineosporiaceae bacterium]|nr:BMP family ABC transporter substrate-binding protein [Kineosporiaceae bacterium]